jgi:hypothetical protein
MPIAVPWAVLGGGALLAGGGVGLHLAAKGTYTAYDQAVTACANPVIKGCSARTELTAQRASGDLLQTLAITSYVVGGAAVATGAVLLYFNRPQPYLRSVDALAPTAAVAPLLLPGGAGLSLAGTF